MSEICLRCDFRKLVNEAKDNGDEVYADFKRFGVDVFVIPKGSKPEVHPDPSDGTIGPQRKLWICELPEECVCGDDEPLRYELTWVPPPPEPPAPPPEELSEFLSLL